MLHTERYQERPAKWRFLHKEFRNSHYIAPTTVHYLDGSEVTYSETVRYMDFRPPRDLWHSVQKMVGSMKRSLQEPLKAVRSALVTPTRSLLKREYLVAYGKIYHPQSWQRTERPRLGVHLTLEQQALMGAFGPGQPVNQYDVAVPNPVLPLPTGWYREGTKSAPSTPKPVKRVTKRRRTPRRVKRSISLDDESWYQPQDQLAQEVYPQRRREAVVAYRREVGAAEPQEIKPLWEELTRSELVRALQQGQSPKGGQPEDELLHLHQEWFEMKEMSRLKKLKEGLRSMVELIRTSDQDQIPLLPGTISEICDQFEQQGVGELKGLLSKGVDALVNPDTKLMLDSLNDSASKLERTLSCDNGEKLDQFTSAVDKLHDITMGGGSNSIAKLTALMDRLEDTQGKGVTLGDEEKTMLRALIAVITSHDGIKITPKLGKVGPRIYEIVLGIIGVIILVLFVPNIWLAVGIGAVAFLFSGACSKVIDWVQSSSKDLSKLAKQMAGFQTQGMEDFTPIVPSIARLFATGLAYTISTKDTRNLPVYIKASQWANSVKGVTSLSDALIKGVEGASDMLWEFETGLPASLKGETLEIYQAIETLHDACEKTVFQTNWHVDLCSDKDKQEFVEVLYNQLLALNHKVTLDADPKFSRSLQPLIKHVENLKKTMLHLRRPGRDRVEPTWVVLQGATGLGKTTMSKRIIMDAWCAEPDALRKEFTYDNIMYTKPHESEYWDGYNQQYGIFIDELFAMGAEHENTLSEARQLLELVSNSPCSLNLAECDLKNKLIPQSHILVTTTNFKNFRDLKMTAPEAIIRRRDFNIQPVIKPQFARAAVPGPNSPLDPALWLNYCQQQGILDTSKPDYANFFEVTDDGTLGRQYTYDGLIAAIRARIALKAQRGTQLIDNLKGLYEQFKVQGDDAPQLPELSQSKLKKAFEKVESKVKELKFDAQIFAKCFKGDVPAVDLQKYKDHFASLDEDQIKRLKATFHIIVSIKETAREDYFGNTKWPFIFKHLDMDFIVETFKPSLCAKIRDSLKQLGQSIKDFITNHPYAFALGIVGSLVALFGVIFGTWYGTKSTYSRPPVITKLGPVTPLKSVVEKIKGEESYKPKGAGVRKPNRVPTRMESTANEEGNFELDEQQGYRYQSLEDPEYENIRPVLTRNLVQIRSFRENRDYRTKTNGIIVCTDWLLCNRHTIYSASEVRDRYITVEGLNRVTLDLDHCAVHSIGDRWGYDDAVLINTPRGRLPGASIIKHFVTLDDCEQIHSTWGELLILNEDDKTLPRYWVKVVSTELTANSNSNYDIGDLKVTTTWEYKAPTKQGDCGSPVIQYSSRGQGRILGIHGASKARQGHGLAIPIDRNWLYQIIGKFNQEGLEDVVDVPDYFSSGQVVLGRVEPGKGVYTPTKSKIKASELGLQLRFPLTTAPTDCSIDNIAKTFKKYRSELPIFDRRSVELITHQLHYRIQATKIGRLLTWDETLNVYGNLDSINMNSSPGYPYNVNKISKKNLVKFDGERFVFVNNEFKKHLDLFDTQYQNFEEPIWATYPKTERLPIEKVKEGKLRLFAASPFDFTLICRRYFGDFISYIREVGHKIGVQVGLDVHSDWTRLATWIQQPNTDLLFIDWSAWDKTVPNTFLEIFFDLADYYYGSQFQGHRDWIKSVILSPTYIIHRQLYKTMGGNPSGCAFTAELNSIANCAVLMYLLLKIGISFDDVAKTRIATWGDDGIMSVPRDYEPNLLSEAAKEMGLKLTSNLKEETLKFCKINQGTFLNRKFVLHQGTYLPPLPLSVIKESLMWIDGETGDREIMQSTLNNALQELRYHFGIGELYLEIMSAANKCGLDLTLNWHIIDQINLIRKEYAPDSSLLMTIGLKLITMIWNSISSEQPPIDIPKVIETIKVKVIDLSNYVSFLPRDIFFHSGIEVNGVEWTFGGNGLIRNKQNYVPSRILDITHVVSDPQELWQLAQANVTGPYHRIYNNCNSWTQRMCKDLRVTSPVSNNRLVQWAKDNQRWLMQGDEKPKGEGDTLLLDSGISKETTGTLTKPQKFVNISGACTRTVKQSVETKTQLATTEWYYNNPIGEELISLDLPGKLFTAPQFAAKLRYNFLVRGDIELELKIATTKFHQGKLMLVYIPQASRGYIGNVKPYYKGLTTMPNVQFNAAEMNNCKLTIPFIHSLNTLKLVEGENLGTVKLIVVNRLFPAEEKRVTVKLFGNFINVEAQIPTPLTGENRKVGSVVGDVGPNYLAQGDESEEKSASGLLTKVGQVAGSLGTMVDGIPIVGDVVNGVRLAADTGSSILRAFGFSKPQSVETTKPMIPRVFTSVAHSDGLDMSQTLGVRPKNNVMINPALFGSSVDQMNLASIIETPMLLLTQEWNGTDQVNETLLSIPITPLLYAKVGPNIQLTPMAYVAMVCEFWRGPMDFQIEVVATSWHKGILGVYYIPGGGNVFGNNEIELETTTTKLLNLTNENVLTFRCDFVSPRVYHKVGELDTQTINTDEAIGTLNIKVMNRLENPSTVHGSVDINVWIAAGPKFHFALPTLRRLNRIKYGRRPVDLTEFVMEGVDDIVGRTDQKPITGAKPFDCMPSDNEAHEDLVMGERIVNLRDILKIFSRKIQIRGTLPPDAHIAIPVHRFVGSSLRVITPTFYDHFMRLFRYSRGAIRQKVAITSESLFVTATVGVVTGSEYAIIDGKENLEGAPWMATASSLNPTLEYSVPYFHHEKQLVHGTQLDDRTVVLQTSWPSAGQATLEIFEAIGDDFSAGYQMFPPLIHIPYSIQSLSQIFARVADKFQDYQVVTTRQAPGQGAGRPWKMVRFNDYDPSDNDAQVTIGGIKYPMKQFVGQDAYYNTISFSTFFIQNEPGAVVAVPLGSYPSSGKKFKWNMYFGGSYIADAGSCSYDMDNQLTGPWFHVEDNASRLSIFIMRAPKEISNAKVVTDEELMQVVMRAALKESNVTFSGKAQILF